MISHCDRMLKCSLRDLFHFIMADVSSIIVQIHNLRAHIYMCTPSLEKASEVVKYYRIMVHLLYMHAHIKSFERVLDVYTVIYTSLTHKKLWWIVYHVIICQTGCSCMTSIMANDFLID